jgi:hypothetical protein
MLAEELGLRNFLNINVVYTRKLAQSITCLSLPKIKQEYLRTMQKILKQGQV